MSWQSGLQMRVLDGPDAGAQTLLDYPKMTIGRARSQGSASVGWVLLFDKSVSRQHAELVWNEPLGRYLLRHLSQTNLSWVDDQPLQSEILLEVGQVIRLGESRMILELASDTAPDDTLADASVAAPPGEVVERISSEQKMPSLALKQSPNPEFVVVSGPDTGLRETLHGFYLTVGRDNLSAAQIHGDVKAPPFDHCIELTDANVLANHLILKWDELRSAFYIWKNPAAANVIIDREADGFRWLTSLTGSGGLVREGDRLTIGDTVWRLCSAAGASGKDVTLSVPLVVDAP